MVRKGFSSPQNVLFHVIVQKNASFLRSQLYANLISFLNFDQMVIVILTEVKWRDVVFISGKVNVRDQVVMQMSLLLQWSFVSLVEALVQLNFLSLCYKGVCVSFLFIVLNWGQFVVEAFSFSISVRVCQLCCSLFCGCEPSCVCVYIYILV